MGPCLPAQRGVQASILQAQGIRQQSACIQGDPRDYILDWVSGKGCRVDREIELPDRFRLSGECRLKWMPTHAVPVVVDLIFGDEKNFKLDLRSEDDPLVEFREKTQAAYLGQCPAP